MTKTATPARGKSTTFIKDFRTEWWTEDTAGESVSLTVPLEQFREAAKTIYLGCQYKKAAADKLQRGSEATQPTACMVDVVASVKESLASGRALEALPGVTPAAAVLSVHLIT